MTSEQHHKGLLELCYMDWIRSDDGSCGNIEYMYDIQLIIKKIWYIDKIMFI